MWSRENRRDRERPPQRSPPLKVKDMRNVYFSYFLEFNFWKACLKLLASSALGYFLLQHFNHPEMNVISSGIQLSLAAHPLGQQARPINPPAATLSFYIFFKLHFFSLFLRKGPLTKMKIRRDLRAEGFWYGFWDAVILTQTFQSGI